MTEHFDMEISKTRLLVLYEICNSINTILDLDQLLEKVMDLMIKELKAERGLILLLNEQTEALEVRLARNLENSNMENAAQYSKNIAEKAGRGQVILTHDATNDERFQDFSSVTLHNIRSVICVPLKVKDKIIGTVYVDCRHTEKQFNEEDLNFLQAFANQAAIAIENAKLYELATVDGLTRLFMKHHFEQLMNDQLRMSSKLRLPVSLIIIDIDNFKSINDEKGHLVGDEILRKVGDEIRKIVASTGIAGRYGGDELIIMLPRCALDDSMRIAEKLRQNIADLSVADLLGSTARLTISLGVASFPEHEGEILVQQADNALYKAKQEGRNCVRFA